MYRCALLVLVLIAVLVKASPSLIGNENKGKSIENILKFLEQEEKKPTKSIEDEKRSKQTTTNFKKQKYTMIEGGMTARTNQREVDKLNQMKTLMNNNREKLTKKSDNRNHQSSGDILDIPVIDPNSPIAIDIESMIDEKDGKSLKAKGLDMSQNQDIRAEMFDHHLLTEKQEIEFGLKSESDADLDSHKRNSIKESYPDGELWPYAIVPYDFQDTFDTEEKAIIKEAIKEMADMTCVQFRPVTKDLQKSLGHDTFIHFKDEFESLAEVKCQIVLDTEDNHIVTLSLHNEGCYSHVGRATPGRQVLSLMRPDCVTKHIATHEMMHAIGMEHEQSRNDRDDYVNINWDNVYRGKNNLNMRKFDTQDNNAYDLESVMQYSQYMFTDNGKKTIEVKDRRLEFLTDIEEGLRFYDVKDITVAYNCTVHCNTTMECKNGGFINHKCECYCPSGLRGETCEELEKVADCGGIIDVGEDPVTIQSPNYPNNYTVGSGCVWLLRAPIGNHVSLEIIDMALADNYLDRCYHWLEIRYNLIGQRGPRECGHTKYRNYVTTRDGTPNLMMLIFNSSMAMNRSTDRGFTLKAYKTHAICLDSPCVFGKCLSNSNGTSLKCACDQGYTGELCDTLIDTKELTCSFEYDEFCFMNNLEGTELNWTTHSGTTTSMDTGPSGAYGGNNYIYVEMTGSYKKYGDAAVLKSLIKFPAEEYCLSFWYNMYGASVNSLTVMGNGSDGNMTMYWNKTGNQGNHWRYAKIDYTNAKNQMRCVGSDTSRTGSRQDDLCHVVHLTIQNCSKEEASFHDGESCDVMCNPDHIFIIGKRGASYNGDIAIDELKFSPGLCAADPCDKNPCKNNGVCSHNTTTYTCICNNGYTGDTCDIEPIKGNDLRCTLEKNTTCFLSPGEHSDVPWRIVDNNYKGPEKAYEGQYYLHAQSNGDPNGYEMAWLKSQNIFPGGEYCIMFAYYLKGYNQEMSLQRYKADTGIFMGYNSIRLPTLNRWVKYGYEFDTQQNDDFKFFLGFLTHGNDSLSLDDMDFCSGFCGCDSYPCQNGATCVPGVGANYTCACPPGITGRLCDIIGNATQTCSFEANETYCFMENNDMINRQWTRNSGRTGSYKTGPDQASDGQYYMYTYIKDMDADSHDSFVMKIDNYNDYTPLKRCFVFDYHMYGPSIHTLTVKNGDTTLFTKKGNQGNKWFTGAVEIAEELKPKIRIAAYGSTSLQGDIAIDNVRLQPGSCGNSQ